MTIDDEHTSCDSLIEIGKILKVKGLKGELRVILYLDNPDNLVLYKTLVDEDCNSLRVLRVYVASGVNVYVLKLKDVDTVELAQKLVNKRLYLEKAEIKSLIQITDDQYYQLDLVGLRVLDHNNELVGYVKHVHNFGSCDVLELEFSGAVNNANNMLAFTKETIKDVDVNTGYIMLNELLYV